MEIKNYHQEAEVSGIQASKFGFEMNAKMYDILISKMYTNKPGAVIRELSANAWDAHVDAGKSDVPFEIHLPTWLDKTFHIRDFGTGIPHDKFEYIYTNVGMSTKEGTNDLIGGFGLGSKTPFTMTDTFVVENWHGGVKTTWVCFKDKGEPNVSKIEEESSDEPSGLKVSFSFDNGDVNEFTKQVVNQLRFFPLKPKITGGEGTVTFPALPDGWETKDYFYLSDGSDYYTHCYVVMGNVSYKMDPYDFDYEYRSVLRNGLVIKVPIGAVDIPPSREHLEMTDRTKESIVAILKNIQQEYLRDLQKAIDACDKQWYIYRAFLGANTDLIPSTYKFTYKGSEIDWRHYCKRYSVIDIAGYGIRKLDKHYTNSYRKGSIDVRRHFNDELTYYVNDLGPGGNKLINNIDYVNSPLFSGNTLPKDIIIFHVKGTVKTIDAEAQKAIKVIEDQIGIKPLLLSSVLGKPKRSLSKNGTPRATSEPNQVFLIKGNNWGYDYSIKANLEEVSGDLPKEGYYIELKNWSLIGDSSNFPELFSNGLLEVLGKPLYAVRSKTIPKLPKGLKFLDRKELGKLEKPLAADISLGMRLETLKDYLPFTLEQEEVLKVARAMGNKRMIKFIRYVKYVFKQKHRCEYRSKIRLYEQLTSKSLKPPKVTIDLRLRNLKEEYKNSLGLVVENLLTSYDRNANKERADALVRIITANK